MQDSIPIAWFYTIIGFSIILVVLCIWLCCIRKRRKKSQTLKDKTHADTNKNINNYQQHVYDNNDRQRLHLINESEQSDEISLNLLHPSNFHLIRQQHDPSKINPQSYYPSNGDNSFADVYTVSNNEYAWSRLFCNMDIC